MPRTIRGKIIEKRSITLIHASDEQTPHCYTIYRVHRLEDPNTPVTFVVSRNKSLELGDYVEMDLGDCGIYREGRSLVLYVPLEDYRKVS